MDLKKEMVIIDNEIVTKDIASCNLNAEKNVYEVKYKDNSKQYNFSKNRIKHIESSNLLNLRDYNFYLNDELLKNIKEVYEFEAEKGFYYHIIFNDNNFEDYSDKELKVINSNIHDIISYMKRVADIISLKTENGKKILSKQMEKIESANIAPALANYLNLSKDLFKNNDIETLIFPFGCNASQYQAVKNAIYNNISVIEGPPGTGKTQTILNIIANIIIRNMNCQVVSFNNTAIENIQDKLKNKYNLDFFVALLGKKSNKDLFIDAQNETIPNLDKYENININEIAIELKNNEHIVRQFYDVKKELSNLYQQKHDLELEYKYFQKLIDSQKIELIELKQINIDKIKTLWNELISMKRISIFSKLKFIFAYKIGDFNFYKNSIDIILKTLQNIIYIYDLEKIKEKIHKNDNFIKENENIEKDFEKISMDYFKKYLFIKYKNGRGKYESSDIWAKCHEFLNDYPVVLSTTYSSRNTLNNDFKFDYIIMDESSQIDVVTGTLALSSAKYAVIIGDEKQLTNVIKPNIAEKVDLIFKEYDIHKSYSYSLNNFLVSVKNSIPDIQCQLLVEHYRCHPKIINFCNKKFYNNELVIMSDDNNENDVIKVIKTKMGNHARGLSNQRQVDEIKNLLPTIKNNDIGIIAPYNDQVDLIKENISEYEVNTVHKYQGREKDVIIISTVDNDISDFVGDSRLLNVAISRAIKQLIMIVTGNKIKNQNINDFINYVNYNNMEVVNGKIYSSFDLLYKQYELERLKFFKKHNRVTKYDSENIIYYLIEDIIKNYSNLKFHFHQSLNDLIKDKSLLNDDERKYVSHSQTHLDFYIFNSLGDTPVLVIEVDGYKNHRKWTKQYKRDLLKNSILDKYNIPWIRLTTNGSGEEESIRNKLNEILK